MFLMTDVDVDVPKLESKLRLVDLSKTKKTLRNSQN